MPERINVYLPDDLHREIEAHRGRLNVSRICQEALAREVARLEALERDDGELPRLAAEERSAIAGRLRAERERRESYWYRLGYRAAFEWARERADDPEALEALASGAALDALPVPGWIEGMQAAPPREAVAARTWGDLRKRALEVWERGGRSPAEDVRSFNHGVRDGAKAVWDEVRDEVVDPEGEADADAEGGGAPGGGGPGGWGPAPRPRPHGWHWR